MSTVDICLSKSADTGSWWTYVCPSMLDKRMSTMDTWLSKSNYLVNFIIERVNIYEKYI